MKRSLVILVAAAVMVASANAAQITGKITEAGGPTATVQVEGELAPVAGDTVEIFFTLADTEVSVAKGTVTKVEGDAVQVSVQASTGEVAKGQSVRINSANPRKRTDVTASPSGTPQSHPPVLTPGPTATKEDGQQSDVKQMASEHVAFDELPVGPLAGDSFAAKGLRIVPAKGKPIVFAAEPNMVLPRPCTKVMLVGDTHVTSFSVRLDSPVRRFALYRIGTANGASTPTWKMMAYNANGKLVGSTGEIHGLPKQPQSFSIAGENIVRVEITTDNRQGSGTWATWSSLPIAAFGFDR